MTTIILIIIIFVLHIFCAADGLLSEQIYTAKEGDQAVQESVRQYQEIFSQEGGRGTQESLGGTEETGGNVAAPVDYARCST